MNDRSLLDHSKCVQLRSSNVSVVSDHHPQASLRRRCLLTPEHPSISPYPRGASLAGRLSYDVTEGSDVTEAPSADPVDQCSFFSADPEMHRPRRQDARTLRCGELWLLPHVGLHDSGTVSPCKIGLCDSSKGQAG